NESSIRAVPIHSLLARSGLMEYAASLPQGSRLFPGLERDKDGKFGTRVGAMFNKRLAKLGIKRGRVIDFHSLRHSAIAAMQAAGESEDNIAPVAGHYHGGITARVYGVQESEIMKNGHPLLKKRAATIEAIAYEGLVVVKAN